MDRIGREGREKGDKEGRERERERERVEGGGRGKRDVHMYMYERRGGELQEENKR